MKTKIFFNVAAIALSVTLAGATYADHHGKQRFSSVDTDGDGLISQDEFEVPGSDRFEKMDTDGDGIVTLDEINNLMAEKAAERQAKSASRREKMEAKIQERFASADQNEDGIITKEELKTSAFSRIDGNADGFLSEEELRDAKSQRSHHKKGHRGGHGR
jgi:Ca2+-binding EF-hand superfamily protein